MDDLQFPVYVLMKDDGTVLKFAAFPGMQSYLEAIDVENDEYDAWDKLGRQLQLAVVRTGEQWLQVRVTSQRITDQEIARIEKKAKMMRETEPGQGFAGGSSPSRKPIAKG